MANDKPLKVGIIGANWGLSARGPIYRSIPGVELGAVCTAHQSTAEAAAKREGIPKAYWDYRDLVADPDIDIIDLGTKPAIRYEMAMAAMAAGKHVYNALPFAMSVDQARDMRDLQRKNGVVGVVDAQFRWVPAIMRMKEMIEEGFLGDPYSFVANVHLPMVEQDGRRFPLCMWSTPQPYLWMSEESSGASAWRNFGSHMMLMLVNLFGEIEEIIGRTSLCLKRWEGPDGKDIEVQTADTVSALVTMKHMGMTGTINISWVAADAGGMYVDVYGSKGRLVLRDTTFADNTATLFAGDTRPRDMWGESGSFVDIPERLFNVPDTPFTKADAPRFTIPMSWLLRDMVRAIRNGGDASPSFNDAYHVHRAVEALIHSMSTRSWQRIDEDW